MRLVSEIIPCSFFSMFFHCVAKIKMTWACTHSMVREVANTVLIDGAFDDEDAPAQMQAQMRERSNTIGRRGKPKLGSSLGTGSRNGRQARQAKVEDEGDDI